MNRWTSFVSWETSGVGPDGDLAVGVRSRARTAPIRHGPAAGRSYFLWMPLQPLLQRLDPAGGRRQRAAAGLVRPAGVAVPAAVRQLRVALGALH
jgi:hypothetical protein